MNESSTPETRNPELENFDEAQRQLIRERLLAWFDAEKRELPWRRDRDPYRVWVSEIMLQQTRVAVVISYYERFMEKFPDVHKLARAKDETVLAAWSGLGYYRRARALHATAKVISREHGGRFPGTARELRNLPGIGRYTAAAIASIAYGEVCAVVDGNVERILGRMLGAAGRTPDGQRDARWVWGIAETLVSPERPGDFNEAMMELGATICTPLQPECGRCPVARQCRTHGGSEVRERNSRKKEEASVALATANGQVYLVKRSDQETVMPGLWELPALDRQRQHETLFLVRHSIMNTDYRVTVARQNVPDAGGEWVSYARAARLPLTGVTRKILAKAGITE